MNLLTWTSFKIQLKCNTACYFIPQIGKTGGNSLGLFIWFWSVYPQTFNLSCKFWHLPLTRYSFWYAYCLSQALFRCHQHSTPCDLYPEQAWSSMVLRKHVFILFSLQCCIIGEHQSHLQQYLICTPTAHIYLKPEPGFQSSRLEGTWSTTY